MRFTIIGSGTSHGVPVIGCHCPVCSSHDPRNRRRRAGALLETDLNSCVLFDTPTELRLQALDAGMQRLDAVCYTHAHADHLHGLDDIRAFRNPEPVPLYASPETLSEIRERFGYIFRDGQKGGGKPHVRLCELAPGEVIEIDGMSIQAVPLLHGELPVYGYRVGDIAYLTDCSSIPEESYSLLKGVRYLFIDALRPEPHPTHFSFEEALAEIRRIGPEQAWFTHLSHDSDHRILEASLPPGVAPAYDGLSISENPAEIT